ncbi:MAG: hypothetical protein AAF638_13425 [Pseudomonadota bacterium]
MTDRKTIGVLALGRPTFDVPFAEETARAAFAALDATGHTIVGTRDLLMDAETAERALDGLKAEKLDLVLLLQVTFSDASMTVTIANGLDAPIAIWAFPEARTGGRLRLNSFCGLNLAVHALGRAGKPYATLFAAPETADLGAALADIIENGPASAPAQADLPSPAPEDMARAEQVMATLADATIGLVGKHPAGFDTCRYDAGDLRELTGARVRRFSLDDLFDRARTANAGEVAEARASVGTMLTGVDTLDPDQLDRSLRVHSALNDLATTDRLSAIAVRCWPETFTDYGCAACGPMAMMSEGRVPCACEADVYGALTSLILQALSDAPGYLVDIVDMDDATGTGVVWHCGLAPISMASPKTPPAADIHSNRKMPLLQAFALKPGRVTLCRLSQAKNETKLVIGGAEMQDAPMSYSGTSGVVRFDAPVDEVRARMLAEGLEHHVSLVYGDHRGALIALAEKMGLPVLVLA